jgi:hypothetical protein
MTTTPTSFRLRPETLAALDRLAELLTQRLELRHERRPVLRIASITARRVSRSEALAVAIADTLQRLEDELGQAPQQGRPFRAAADGSRGLLAHLGAGSAVDELAAERRAEAAAEERGLR